MMKNTYMEGLMHLRKNKQKILNEYSRMPIIWTQDVHIAQSRAILTKENCLND